MSTQTIIEEEFKKSLIEVDVDETHDLMDVFKYFFVKGLRAATKIEEELNR